MSISGSAAGVSSAIWAAPHRGVPVQARVGVPGSKSLTNRALILGALATGPSLVRAPLRSRDTLLMAAALRALGTDIHSDAADWLITPQPATALPAGVPAGRLTVECGNAGTVARFLPAVAALTAATVHLTGDPRMSERPLSGLVGALRDLGARLEGDVVPLTIYGRGAVPGGIATLDASPSSQLVSGILLSAARFTDGVDLRHRGEPVPSKIQVEMTVRMLREHGVEVVAEPDRWQVRPGPVAALDRTIEPDLSSASAFLAAAVATSGRVTLADWPVHSLQPGRLLPELLSQMGATVSRDGADLVVTGPDRLVGIDVDLHAFGEAVPTLTALAVLADTPSQLRGVAHLRLQETDRLAALASEFGKLGARIEVTSDGLAITPAPLRAPDGVVLDPHADHRLAMAFAVVGLAIPGVRVSDIDTTSKTVPGFAETWAQMVSA